MQLRNGLFESGYWGPRGKIDLYPFFSWLPPKQYSTPTLIQPATQAIKFKIHGLFNKESQGEKETSVPLYSCYKYYNVNSVVVCKTCKCHTISYGL